jgi:hypothetical protein
MPMHTRNLPTNSKTVLDELVDPDGRQASSSSPDARTSSNEPTVATPRSATPPERSEFEPADAHHRVASDLPWYRRETWLAFQVAAIVPILAAMLVPAPLKLPLCVLGGALVAVGTVMLLRHEPARVRARSDSA